MIRRLLLMGTISAMVSVVATFAAVFLYIVVIGREPVGVEDLAYTFVFGRFFAFFGSILALVLGLLLYLLREFIPPALFAAIASICAGISGGVFAFVEIGESPHVSKRLGAALLALTWFAAAALLSAVFPRRPN